MCKNSQYLFDYNFSIQNQHYWLIICIENSRNFELIDMNICIFSQIWDTDLPVSQSYTFNELFDTDAVSTI